MDGGITAEPRERITGDSDLFCSGAGYGRHWESEAGSHGSVDRSGASGTVFESGGFSGAGGRTMGKCGAEFDPRAVAVCVKFVAWQDVSMARSIQYRFACGCHKYAEPCNL